MRILSLSLLTLFIAGCGSTAVRTNADGTYSVSAQYGSVNGSWDRASREANEKAVNFCNELSQGVVVLSERQDGEYGFTPQRADVRFQCLSKSASNSSSSKEALVAKLQKLKALYDDGLLTKAQYDAQVSRELNPSD